MKRTHQWGIFLVLISLAHFSYAQKTAKTGTPRNWNTASSWSPVGVPVNGDIIVIPANAVMRVDANTATVASITIEAGGNLTALLSNAITTSGNFSNAGSFVGASGAMVIGGSLANTSSFTAGTGSITVAAGITNSGTFTASGSITSTTLTNSNNFTGGPGSLSLSGNFSNSGNFTAGTGAIACAAFTNTGTFTGNTGTFTLSGNFTNNNIFNAGTGLITFSGTSGLTQTVSGTSLTTFNNLRIINGLAAIDVQVTSPQQLLGVLSFSGAAHFNVTGSGNFTLLSLSDSPVSDASIGALPSGAQVTGNITVQRYISQENRVYRYISSPILGITAADWQDDFSITGAFGGASTADPFDGQTSFCGFTIRASSPSMYRYDEALAGDKDNFGWVAYTGGAIQQGRGYAAFIRESCKREVIIDATGTINQGNIPLPVTYNGNTSIDDDGWNLVGNPYPSAIQWNPGGTGWVVGADISTAVQVRDNISGMFIPIIAGGEIAQGQAFWVKANGNAATLTIQEDAKVVASASTEFYRLSSAPQRDLIELYLSNGVIRDKAYIRWMADATNGFEKNDLINFDNTDFDIATKSGTRALAVNSLGTVQCGDVISLVMTDVTNGVYELSIATEGLFEGFDILLHDKFTKGVVNLSEVAGYSFEVSAAPGSRATDRFDLELSLVRTPVVSGNAICNAGSTLLAAEGIETGSYNWYDAVDASSPIHQGVTFQTPELSFSKTYFVSAINPFGCEGPRVPVTAEVKTYDAAVIEVAGRNKLQSNYTVGNQWYFNDSAIPGGDQPSVIAVKAGTYRLDVTVDGCVTTDAYEKLIHANEHQPLTVFPNPVSSSVELHIEFMATQSGPVYITNSQGTKLSEVVVTSYAPGIWGGIADVSALAQGIYFVRVRADGKVRSVKFIRVP